MASCREFNFIARDNEQSKDPEYGGKKDPNPNTYPGYEKKIFILDGSTNNTNGGITFINGIGHQARSVSNNNNNDFTIDAGSVKFYPRVEKSSNPGTTGNDFALFNGSSILKDADIKHADIHLTHTLFQKTNNDNIVTKDDGTTELTETNIETDGKPMTENNVYTFIDEGAIINGTAGKKCEIGPNIYIGKKTEIGPDNKLSNIYIGPDCELNTPWDYRPENPSGMNKTKLNDFFTTDKTFIHVGNDDSNSIIMKKITTPNNLLNEIHGKQLLKQTLTYCDPATALVLKLFQDS